MIASGFSKSPWLTLARRNRFDFGPCIVLGLRDVVRFLGDASKSTVGGGFQNPDVRYYDVISFG